MIYTASLHCTTFTKVSVTSHFSILYQHQLEGILYHLASQRRLPRYIKVAFRCRRTATLILWQRLYFTAAVALVRTLRELYHHTYMANMSIPAQTDKQYDDHERGRNDDVYEAVDNVRSPQLDKVVCRCRCGCACTSSRDADCQDGDAGGGGFEGT